MSKSNMDAVSRINEDWFECRINDECRLDLLEKALPERFKKQDFLDVVQAAKEPEKQKLNISNLTSSVQKRSLSPDPAAKTKELNMNNLKR